MYLPDSLDSSERPDDRSTVRDTTTSSVTAKDPDPGEQGPHVVPFAHVVPLAPVLQGRAMPTLPRTLVVAIVVGVIAFVFGVQLDGGRSSGPPIAIATPSTSPGPIDSSSPTSPAPPRMLSPTSTFADHFQPQDLIAALPGGKACVTENTSVPGSPTAASGRSLVRTWLAFCPMKIGLQADFRDQLFQSLADELPGSTGWGAGVEPTGLWLAAMPYADGPLKGTVAVAALADHDPLVITITLDEMAPP